MKNTASVFSNSGFAGAVRASSNNVIQFASLISPLAGTVAALALTGIGLLVETYKRLHLAGQTLRLVNLLPRVRNVFAYAGLDRVLTLE